MNKRILYQAIGIVCLCLVYGSCKVPKVAERQENAAVPNTFDSSATTDTTSSAAVHWRDFFTDPYLVSLIDTALKNNQELNITLQEIEIAKNEVRAKKGDILPSVNYHVGAGVDKAGRYTSQGAGDASTEMTPGKAVPEYLGDFALGLDAEWEADIWHKLHDAQAAEVDRYLATVEGKNFVLTNLIAEVANSYYELLALDYQLGVVKQSIVLQQDALEIVKAQKEAARANELGVQQFAAQVKSTQSREFEIAQDIKETENRINFLLARFPQKIERTQTDFINLPIASVSTGVPSSLLENRPDIRQAALELAASKLDVKVARAEFYPSFTITAALGFDAFSPKYLFRVPQSIATSLLGDVAGPLINKNAIKAEYYSANARQLQAVYNYERSILNGYVEVSNGLSGIANLQKSYDQQTQQVAALNNSIEISNSLFKSARVDYLDVLTAQRDALEAKLDLVDTKKGQLNAVVNMYKALGGGWK
ncbi:MAG: TolC family protein [Chitinophagaceae bacterium]